VVVAAPAQRIKPSGQTKPGRSVVSEFRESVTFSYYYKMHIARKTCLKMRKVERRISSKPCNSDLLQPNTPGGKPATSRSH